MVEKAEARYSVGVVVTLTLFLPPPLSLGQELGPTLMQAKAFFIIASACAVVDDPRWDRLRVPGTKVHASKDYWHCSSRVLKDRIGARSSIRISPIGGHREVTDTWFAGSSVRLGLANGRARRSPGATDSRGLGIRPACVPLRTDDGV